MRGGAAALLAALLVGAVRPCPCQDADPRGPRPAEGDDDLIVSVAETRLAGARDFLVVPTLHSAIINNEAVQRATLRSLHRGYFVSEQQRHPIAWAAQPMESR